MKKTKLFAVLAICLAIVLMMTACQAALINSNVTVNADGSGTKTITAVIYSDDAILAGEENAAEPGTVGNNSKYLLVSGEALVAKIKSYSALEDIDITVGPDGGNTVVTIKYAFDSVENYTEKTKKLVFSANGTNENTMDDAPFAYFNGSNWTVSNTGDATLQVIDMLGRIVSAQTLNGNTTINPRVRSSLYIRFSIK